MPRIRNTLALLTLLIHQFASASGVSISERGILSYGSTHWGTLYMDGQWQSSFQAQAFTSTKAVQNHYSGPFKDRSGSHLFDYKLSFQAESNTKLSLNAAVQSIGKLTANMLAYQGRLPIADFSGSVLEINGEELQLPETFGEQTLLLQAAREVVIPTAEGQMRFTGNFTVMVVDSRKFGGSDYLVRFFYSTHKGEIDNSKFGAQLAFAPNRVQQLSFRGITNRTFSDDVAGDGRGGWTDQGPDNDLSTFDAGSRIRGKVPFDIIDAGPSAIVLSAKPERSDMVSAQIDLPDSQSGTGYLYLLHASAYTWGTVGKIKVTYHDGSEQFIEVEASRDVGNWWNPAPFANAALAWTGKSAEANIGLYISRFELKKKSVRTISFSAHGEPIWMLVAATLSSAKVSLPKPEYFEVQVDPQWAPIDVPLEVKPGSALDFSQWIEQPAGQHGAVITTEDGHFAFAERPEEPVRFWGTNLNFTANFIPKAKAERLALRLRQMGYNAVRIHHYDVLLAGGWHPDEYRIDSEKLDRLDYLFHVMKEQGLYISTDLYTIRRIRNPELAAYDANNHAVYKALVPLLPAAMEDWKRFARDFLGHINPYTGMSWAEDPALFSIAPVNEDSLWVAINADPDVRALYESRFEEWLCDNTRPVANEAQRATAFNEFIVELHLAADAEMRRYLRDELGCRALLTGNNWKTYRAQTPLRAAYDYVDNHCYWDHPNFPKGPWNYPFSHSQRSATANLADVPRRIFLTRIENRPFTITEFNYVYPNRYRSEGGALMGSYAALQDYDGLFRFSWAHGGPVATSSVAIEGFDVAQDPVNLLSEHIIGMLWYRGDMPAFESEAVYQVDTEEAFYAERFAQAPPEFSKTASLLGLSKRISSRFLSGQELPDGVNEAFEQVTAQSRYTSELENARVILDKRGDFLAETRYSKVATVQQQSLDPEFVGEVTGGPATVFAGSIDHKTLDQSTHILVLHLTDVLSEGMRFAEKERYTILDKGTANKLIRTGTAQIMIPQSKQLKNTTVYAIALDGSRICEVPYNITGDKLSFLAETVSKQRIPVMAYEIVRQ